MRVSVARRRRWNNILIIGVIAFIALLNLPSVIKTYLIDDSESSIPSTLLLNPNASLKAIYFSDWSLEKVNGQWLASRKISIEAEELVSRWSALVGTPVDETTFEELAPKLGVPNTVEVWYEEMEEPQRITIYQLPTFFLFKSWQGKWLAISVSEEHLYP